MSNKTLDPILVVSDTWGIYIPQRYCNHIDEKIAEEMQIDFEDVKICQEGPDHEWYWESWQMIHDNAEWVSDGVKWALYQDGDLWEIPEGFSFEDES